ncbi:MAG: hypothetical protein ACRCUU_09870 [Plesiomonas sp.]
MAITRADLKIFKPEMLGSSDDAGGQRTKIPVVSGKLNELFPAISDIDHAASAVDIVKCYPALDTTATPVLLDGHVFISEPPTDPLVSMIIAEDVNLNDASRMTDMKDILESSVRAGQLIRGALTGLLAGQDTFPRALLQTTYQFNGTEYWETITLQQGTIIVISVEYRGNESAEYPRFEHFCQITETVTGGQGGVVKFSPPIPTNTPDHDVILGNYGEAGCTKLRYTSENLGIKYHGVSKLTAPNTLGSNLLSVENTKFEMLPKLRTVKNLIGLNIEGVTADDSTGVSPDEGGIYPAVRLTATQPTVAGQSTYIFDLPDALVDDYFGDRSVEGYSTGDAPPVRSINRSGTQFTVTLYASPAPWMHGAISLTYFNTPAYVIYHSANPFPANRQLCLHSLHGEVDYVHSAYPNVKIKMVTDAISAPATAIPICEVNGRTLGHINARTGVFTKADLDYRGDFTISYKAMLLATVVGGDGNPIAPGETTAKFTLKSSAPILSTFYMTVATTDDVLLSASADANGVITGAGVTGNITAGVVTLNFTDYVRLSTLRYDISETVTLSPPPELYSLNPLRIKNSGVVDIFTAWTPVSVQHTQTQVVSAPAPGQTKTVRPNARFADITDAEGKSLWTVANTHYTWDKVAGTVTINSAFPGFTAPFILTNTIGEVGLVTAVGSNSITLASPLSQVYPIGANVSSVQNLGDLQARIGTVRDMTSWANNWDVDGSPATGNLNTVDYPIEVHNNTAVNEDWVLIFTSPTAFRCVGKRLGQIATGDTLNDFAPVNPLTLAPYFVIRKGAFGGGWQTGEAIRFRSFAAAQPVMLLRTVQSGHSQITTDRAVLAFRGNES